MQPSALSQRSLPAGSPLYLARATEASVRRAVGLGLNVVVVGADGVGKTTIVRQALAAESTPPAGRLIWVDAAGCTPRELPERVAEEFGWSKPDYRLEMKGILHGGIPGITERVPVQPDPKRIDAEDIAFLAREIERAPESLEFDPAGNGWLVVVDSPPPSALHEFWDRHREAIWLMPVQWIVVTTRIPVAPAAGLFFDTKVLIDDLDDETARILISRRLEATGRVDPDRAERIAESIVGRVPSRPRELIAAARDSVLEGSDDVRLSRYAGLAEAAAGLGRRQAMLMAEVIAAGCAHASDESLQRRLGYSRPRLAQLLDELASHGLLVRERDGRRVMFAPAKAMP